MIKCKQVCASYVNLDSVDESSLLQPVLWQIIVNLNIAQLEVRTVTKPEITGLIVVGIRA